jgi:NAD(P) transhydrogenase subunit beta
MAINLESGLYIFILSAFLGYHLIARIPPLLHTPLMSATNAISGISLIGSMVVAGAGHSQTSTILGFIAVACSATNVVGGFLITDRMLKMFKSEHEGDRRDSVKYFAAGIIIAAGVLIFVTRALSVSYLCSAVLFILGLKGLSSPKHARRGMFLAQSGMVMAVAGTLLHPDIVTYTWIVTGISIGTIVGGAIGLWVPMTAVPQRTALSHSLGALAVALIGVAEYIRLGGGLNEAMTMAIGFEVIVGGLTVTGSLMAAGKLQGILPGAPWTYRGQNAFNMMLLGVLAAGLAYLVANPSAASVFFGVVVLALIFGVSLVMPIGAADMPVVIALLNSYAGLSGAAMGFVLANQIQIITGALDGASGFLLSLLMCRAMNRPASNVLFGAFGKGDKIGPATIEGKGSTRSIFADEVPGLLENARSVIIVPGYGMAVAQAQNAVAELSNLLLKRGVDVKYGIHPVAGRMPGHMNVLLAEANIPYDRLYEMEQINPAFAECDVALVIGANDVTNPAAKHDRTSPLYGMPILEVERARCVIVLKRSMRPGFAGVENELYNMPNCMMLFGDAKDSITKVLSAMK